jgi:hypothetical protein
MYIVRMFGADYGKTLGNLRKVSNHTKIKYYQLSYRFSRKKEKAIFISNYYINKV